MRYITLLLTLALLLSACATGETKGTEPSTEALTTEFTVSPTVPVTEPTSPTEETVPPETTSTTISAEEYAQQIGREYLQSRLDYLTGNSDDRVLHTSEGLMEEIRTLRQTLDDDGIKLRDADFYFSGIVYEGALTVLYMGKHISYSTEEGNFGDNHIYRLDMETGADGALTVIGDAPTRPYFTEEEGEAYARQIAAEYLQSCFDYFSSGGQAEVAPVSEALMSALEDELLALTDEGFLLIDGDFTIGEAYYEGVYSYVLVRRTVTYSVGGQKSTDEIETRLFIADGVDGQYVVAGEDFYSELYGEEETP